MGFPGRKPVGRLAPTPSAGLHVGNIFASMVAWLAARSQGGSVVLRIEDLDAQRCRREYADAAMRDFERLGLNWDNVEIVYQRDRTDAYRAAFSTLEGEGRVYPCFCSRADLHAASAPHVGERYLYAGTCRNLSDEEQSERARLRSPSYRLQVPEKEMGFSDRLQGEFQQDLAGECGDFIIRRSDGVYAYQLAVVVDDLFQGVTQVVRGCDLLDSTPQQLYLRRLLDPDAPEPEFWHIPLLLDGEGRRLSKRDRDQCLDGLLGSFRDVESFIGYLAGLTGIAPTQEPLTMEELLQLFDPEALKSRRSITWNLPDENGAAPRKSG